MLRSIPPIACSLAILLAGAPCAAQIDAPADAPTGADEERVSAVGTVHPAGLAHLTTVIRMFQGRPASFEAAQFTPGFKERGNIEELQQAIEQLSATNEGYTHLGIIDFAPGLVTSVVRSNKTGARSRVSVQYEADGLFRIDGVLIHPDLPGFAGFDDFEAALEALGNEASVSIAELLPDGTTETLFSFNESSALAIGAHVRLLVLGSLIGAIETEDFQWLSTIAVTDELKSIPAGQTFADAPGTALPVTRYAKRMVVDSDLSAMDHLIAAIGAGRIESVAREFVRDAEGLSPFLSTKQRATLQRVVSASFAERWAAADTAARRELLAEIDGLSAGAGDADAAVEPSRVESIGWFAGAKPLNTIFAGITMRGREQRHSAVTAIMAQLGPAPVDSTIWTASKVINTEEPGVIASSWLLAHRDGRVFVMTGVFNDGTSSMNPASIGALLIASAETLARVAPRVEDNDPSGGGTIAP